MSEKTIQKPYKILVRIENNIIPLVDLVAKKRRTSRTSIINLALSFRLASQKTEITKELKACKEVLYCK